jgi:hypothetical protein
MASVLITSPFELPGTSAVVGTWGPVASGSSSCHQDLLAHSLELKESSQLRKVCSHGWIFGVPKRKEWFSWRDLSRKSLFHKKYKTLVMDIISVFEPGDRFKAALNCKDLSWKERGSDLMEDPYIYDTHVLYRWIRQRPLVFNKVNQRWSLNNLEDK